MKNKGLTMIEVLVAIAIMGIMFTMIAGLIVLFRKNFQQEQDRSEMFQGATTALTKLTREVMETSYNTVSIYTSTNPPKGIVFASARSPILNNTFILDSSTADCKWQKYVCYYLDTDPENSSQKALFRKEKLLTTPTTTKTTSSDTTLTFKNDSSLPYRVIAHNVSDLTFPELSGKTLYLPSDISTKLPLKIGITLSKNASSSQYSNSIGIVFSVNMHN